MALHISILNIFLSIVILLHNWKINKISVFLSLLIFLISTFSITHYLVLHATEPFWLAITFNNQTPLWCLIGPCLFFYIRGVLTDRLVFKWVDLLHTIPFWVTLIGIFPYLLTSFEYKLSVADLIIHHMDALKGVKVNWLLPQEVNLLVRPVLQITYSLACLVILVRFHRNQVYHLNRPVRQYKFVYRWLLVLTLFVLSIGAYYLWALILFYSNPVMERKLIFEFQAVYFIGASLIFMPFLIFIFPKILYGIPKYGIRSGGMTSEVAGVRVEQTILIPTPDASVPAAAGSLQGDDMGGDPFTGLSDRILEVMEEKKPFLNEDFSLEDLATLLDVPKHHLYYSFRNILQTRFISLRTEFRIAYAKKILLEADLRMTTLDALGKKCGFASRSAFYKTFKQEVGCSPGEYLERFRNDDGMGTPLK